MKYKEFNIPDNEVDKIVDNLECSIAEACEMWLADHDKVTNEEQEQAQKNATQNGKRHYEKSKTLKTATKERKVDEIKAELLEIMRNSLEITPEMGAITQKTETELHFEYKNAEYTVKLTKHRPKK